MKLSVRIAGVCASGFFMLTALPGFYHQIGGGGLSPSSAPISGVSLMETLLLSLAGSVIAGVIGYKIGEILSHPKGRQVKPVRQVQKTVTQHQGFAKLDNIIQNAEKDSPAKEAESPTE